MLTVSKKVSFDAAHYLPEYEGKCQRLHGHHWVVELGVKGPIKNSGFVIDFSKLSSWLKEHVVNQFDHTVLNDIIGNPTAENIAIYIRNRFITTADLRCNLVFIKVWETENSMACHEEEYNDTNI